MKTIEEIHQKNPDLKYVKHELIWSLKGKYRIYLRVFDDIVKFILFSDVLYSQEMARLLTLITHNFIDLYFYEGRGLFETLYLIEKELREE